LIWPCVALILAYGIGTSRTGEVVFNERWAEMLGYRLDEILPHYNFLTQLVHPDDLPGGQTVFSAHLDGETPFYETEFRMRAKSSEWKWILARGKVVARDAHGKPLRATHRHASGHYRVQTP
jgi:PAS domain S-box-containing protein